MPITGVAGSSSADDLMRAAVFRGPGRLELARLPRPRLSSPLEILIEVEACGICGSDLHILEDPPGHPATVGVVLGHELVGRIVVVGREVSDLSPGQRVAVAPNIACGRCRLCQLGSPSLCQNLTTVGVFRDGGLAELVAVPATNCHLLGDKVEPRLAALTEPLSCVLSAVQEAKPLAGEVAVIYGAGAIGLLFLAVLTANGVRCIVVEPADGRRETAQRMGAIHSFDGSSAELATALGDLVPDGADLTVDAVGSLIGPALENTRAGGRALLFGLNTQATTEIRQSVITRRSLRVIGTYVGDFTFPAAIRLQESGLLDLDPIVSHFVPLEETPAAIEALRSRQAVKVVVDVAGSS